MKNNYLASYRLLEIEPGSSWPETRKAYKRLVKKWHPDHFHDDAQSRSLANEKIKEINCAFDLLSEYYRAHGVLPLPAEMLASSLAEAAQPQQAGHASRPHETNPARVSPWSVERAKRAGDRQKPRSGFFARLVVISLVTWLGYALWSTLQTPQTGDTHELDASDTPSSPSTAVDTTGYPNTEPAPAPVHKYFTYGSTVGDVYEAQGTPSNTSDGVWSYGKSKVYFNHGKVARWEDDPTSPLKASADIMYEHTPATTFGVGSTKAEVRALQGKPLMEWDSVWEYGTSKVYFDGDRVSGWYGSPLNPLRTHK